MKKGRSNDWPFLFDEAIHDESEPGFQNQA